MDIKSKEKILLYLSGFISWRPHMWADLNPVIRKKLSLFLSVKPTRIRKWNCLCRDDNSRCNKTFLMDEHDDIILFPELLDDYCFKSCL